MLTVILILGLAGLMLLSQGTAWNLLHYPQEDPVEARLDRLARGEIPLDWDQWGWELERLQTPRGFLAVRGLAGKPGVSQGVIFIHGAGTTSESMIKYMPPFHQRGWALVSYDLIGTGLSSPGKLSFGPFEAQELEAVFAWARERFPSVTLWAACGESLGASLAIDWAGRHEEAFMVLADCPFADFETQCLHLMRHRAGFLGFLLPRWYRRLALLLAERITRIQGGFGLREFRPIDQAAISGRRSLPLLLIHGAEDRYVPPSESRRLAGSRPGGCTVFWEVPEARHAKSWRTDPETYRARVESFLERFGR